MNAEKTSRLSKGEYESLLPDLRVGLINAQYDLRNADFAVLVLIAGDDRLSCSDIIDILHEWMDARYIDTRVFLGRSEEEAERPRYWRYWKALPRKGQLGIHLGGIPALALYEKVLGYIKKKAYQRRIEQSNEFEKCLSDDGMLILKFWMHLPKKEAKKRWKKLSEDPDVSWLVDDLDKTILDNFDALAETTENYLKATSQNGNSWHVVHCEDERQRNITVARTILDALDERLQSEARTTALPSSLQKVPNTLATVDLNSKIEKKMYKAQLKELQAEIGFLTRKAREQKRSTVLLFEGWDAAGKGGVIRRITGPMTARDYRVVPVAAPNEEERAQHYLWRFWRQLPRAGRMLIFDRSWYGRVLVERVEGFATEAEWSRAYDEINEFEAQLVEHGIVFLKFWLHISPEEQLARFEAREKTSYKKYKITDEDYRNREKWPEYEAAANEMFARASIAAPWQLVPANDKRFARIQVLRTVRDALQKSLVH